MPTTLAQNFESYLLNSEVSNVTLRNYRADLGNFLTWTQTFLARRGVTVLNDSSLVAQFSPFLIKEYVKSQTLENTPPATINRRLSSLRSFGKFLVGTGYLKDNPFSSFQNLPNPVTAKQQGSQAKLEVLISAMPNKIVSRVQIKTPEVNLSKTSNGIPIPYSRYSILNTKYLMATVFILLALSLTQTYFLIKKSPAKKKTVVLGTKAETGYRLVTRRFPLPAPSITFGDLLKK